MDIDRPGLPNGGRALSSQMTSSKRTHAATEDKKAKHRQQREDFNGQDNGTDPDDDPTDLARSTVVGTAEDDKSHNERKNGSRNSIPDA
jgi:hypothetical protein